MKQAYIALAQRYASLDHVFMAYALKEKGVVKRGHCDDNEHGGGNAIARVLSSNKVHNTAIFIARKYGGIHLGLDRYQTIETVTKEAIKLVNPELNLENSNKRTTTMRTPASRGRGGRH